MQKSYDFLPCTNLGLLQFRPRSGLGRVHRGGGVLAHRHGGRVGPVSAVVLYGQAAGDGADGGPSHAALPLLGQSGPQGEGELLDDGEEETEERYYVH